MSGEMAVRQGIPLTLRLSKGERNPFFNGLLDADYDVVINIDGFNEIDLVTENLAAGVSRFYPYRWNVHARQGLDTTAMGHAGRIEIIRERRQDRIQRHLLSCESARR